LSWFRDSTAVGTLSGAKAATIALCTCMRIMWVLGVIMIASHSLDVGALAGLG
jgi:hypothetical protein